MNANLITFEDKVTMAQNPSIPDKNKITSDDINQIKDAINSGLLNLIYPVGCYFETSDDSFNPNTSWGEVWQLDSVGKITISQDLDDEDFSVLESTGGSKTHT